MSKSVFIIAGEASGDLHGANLIKEIKKLDPDISFFGIGGERMKKEGVNLICSSADIAVVGFTEIISKLRAILKAAAAVKRILREKRPSLLILIDYPEFNLHIAGYAKKIAVPVMYYISPQVWAWRKGRIRKIRERVDRMVVILPFEEEFYRKNGIDVSYVGHPILDEIPERIDKDELRRRLDLFDSFPTVTVLPGSRTHEIKNTLPIMLSALNRLKRRYRRMKAFLVLADTLEEKFVRSFIKDNSLKIVPNSEIYNILSVSDIAFVTSGTATLQTAIMQTPMIVVYKGSYISFLIAKTLVKIPYISLPNLIAGKKIVPELIQNDFTVENLVENALKILEDSGYRKRMKEDLRKVKESLGMNASKKAAQIAYQMIRKSYDSLFKKIREKKHD